MAVTGYKEEFFVNEVRFSFLLLDLQRLILRIL